MSAADVAAGSRPILCAVGRASEAGGGEMTDKADELALHNIHQPSTNPSIQDI